MCKHAKIWTWIMFAVSLVAGLIFLLVAMVGLANLDELVRQGAGKYTRDDAIAACVIYLVLGAVSILGTAIVAPLSIRKINSAERRGQLIALGVLSIIFNCIVPGILMLCIRQSELDPRKNN